MKRTESIYSEHDGDSESLSKYAKDANKVNAQACKISFKNVKYTVTVPTTREERKEPGVGNTKQLQVLKDCTGYALPGQTCFIMGASGAGKTSLLNVMADRIGRASGSSLSGEVMLNDKYNLNQSLFAKYSSYVMQDDVIFQYFTVKEALTFSARLKLQIPE